MVKGQPIGRFSGSPFNRSRKFAVEKPVSVDTPSLRLAVLDLLREKGPLSTDDVVAGLKEKGIGNESAIKRCLKWLGEDGKILRPTSHFPWRLA